MAAKNSGLTAEVLLEIFRLSFEQHAHPESARQMKAYMKGHFPFFGLKTPLRTQLVREIIDQEGKLPLSGIPDFFKLCFQQEQREFHYLVGDFGKKYLKQFKLDFIDLVELLIPQNSWWDTIDFLSPKLAGGVLLSHPEHIAPTVRKWIASDNFWFQRSAILLQLHYKNKTDTDLLFECILRRTDSKEFFVQKAAGWALREYSKTDPEVVVQFIGTNQLPALTVREGLKWVRQRGLA